MNQWTINTQIYRVDSHPEFVGTVPNFSLMSCIPTLIWTAQEILLNWPGIVWILQVQVTLE